MEQPRFVLDLSGLTREGKRIPLSPYLVENFKIEEWSKIIFSIKETATTKPAAVVTFRLYGNSNATPPFLLRSSEENSLALAFFRTFKQSPFRLLLFSSLSFLEKKGLTRFVAENGKNDAGVAHKKQIQQGIFSHASKKKDQELNIHIMKDFPKLSFEEFNRILAQNIPVPTRLLEPSSPLRKIRATSFTKFKIKRMGKAKYRKQRNSLLRK